MSTRRDTKYVAKRRAANRKRLRDIVRYTAIFGFIGILIIGTVDSFFVATSPTTVTTPATAPTATTNASLASLVTQGDAAIASGDYNAGLSYYLAYSSQNPTDADVLFKVGKAYVDPKNPSPDYLAGVSYLQRALNANPAGSWISEATSLITQYAPQADAAATSTAISASQVATGTITGTTTPGLAPTITGTNTLTNSAVAPTTVITK